LLQRAHAAVEDGEAYFSFHLDEPESFLWVVTRRELRMFHLPGRRHLARLVSQFQAAVKLNLPKHVQLGQELYAALFGPVPEGLLSSPRWSVALQGELYEIPMAALVVSAHRAKPEYLAERHVIRMVPSALLLERGSGPVWDGPFVGVGDPIYNTADERLTSRRQLGRGELPRLAASGGEIGACARAWGGEVGGSVLLTGSEASLKGLDRALVPGVAVLHFATHFLPSAASARQAMIALSLDAQGAPELLGAAEISRRRLDLGLAVLSGCASASAEAAPAEGLLGVTRAWLAAGARSVLATLWPTPDDQGRLLVSFYTHLARLRGKGDGWVVAEALRSAQLDALRSGAAYGAPAHWGAYVLAGRE
jgi:CHAT domain-containing protein